MEEEKAEAVKSYNNSFLGNIEQIVKVGFVLSLICYCFPAIVSILQVTTVCFDWFRWVLNNYFSFSWLLNNYFLVLVLNGLIVFFILPLFRKTAEKDQPDLYDQYFAAAPTIVHSSPAYNYRVTEVEDDNDAGYNNNWSYYTEVVPVKTVTAVKECNCCDRVVMEENSKNYRRTRSEKKTETKTTKVEYRRTESERVTKTASWTSNQTMNGMSSEEFRMTVETFITQKKMMRHHQNSIVDQQQNGVVDQWQNGVPLRQNSVVDQWRDGVLKWQGSRDKGTDRHRHRSRSSRSHRLEGGSGSTGSGPYLAISN